MYKYPTRMGTFSGRMSSPSALRDSVFWATVVIVVSAWLWYWLVFEYVLALKCSIWLQLS